MRSSVVSLAIVGASVAIAITGCAGESADTLDPAAAIEAYPAAYEQADAWPQVPAPLAPVKSSPPLAGTATGAAATVSAVTLDWQNMTYPTPCVSSGQARLTRGSLNSGPVTVTARPPVFGDLDGDRNPEAVVTLTCVSSEDRLPDRALVYSTAAGRPELLGLALTESAGQELLYAEFRDRAVIVVGAGYSPTAKAGTPDLAITTTSRLDGRRLKQESRYIDPMEILYEAHEGDDAH